jgi:hypothetical protein
MISAPPLFAALLPLAHLIFRYDERVYFTLLLRCSPIGGKAGIIYQRGKRISFRKLEESEQLDANKVSISVYVRHRGSTVIEALFLQLGGGQMAMVLVCLNKVYGGPRPIGEGGTRVRGHFCRPKDFLAHPQLVVPR